MIVKRWRIGCAGGLVAQQPDPTYVHPLRVTQFSADTEGIGLLGESWPAFLNLGLGDLVQVWDDAGVEYRYRVRDILEAEAVEPNNPYSDFIMNGERLSSTDLFHRVYEPALLVCQTCRLGRRFRHFARAALEEVDQQCHLT